MRDLSVFTQKLMDSGYGKSCRREILTSGIKRYYHLVLQEIAGGRSVYRSVQEMLPQRRIKLLKTKRWFKPLRGGTRVSGNKDFPTASSPGPKRKPGNNWRVPNQQPRPQEMGNQEREAKVKVTEAPIFLSHIQGTQH